MRTELKKIGADERHTYTGEFVRFGEKKPYKGHIPDVTVLLANIKDLDGNIVTDHLWFNLTKSFQKCDLKEHDIVQFDARVAEYEKGYKGYRDWDDYYFPPVSVDYKLSHPTKVSVIGRSDNNLLNK